jgi:DNA processing protein
VHVAQELGHGLAERGVCVVSGGAYGIDVAAHRGALASEQTPTIAVLACGVDVVYPRGNDRVLARIAATGLVVSELPPGSAPTRVRFLVRNRLIAALTLGTVVVEAALRSGSLATVERASSLRKVCMAVPGPVTSAMSAGCHDLLRRAEAVLVCDAEQVLDAAGRLGDDAAAPVRGRADPRDGLSETVRRVLDAVPVRAGAGEASIARTAGIAPLVVQQVLPPLEIHGLVERCSTGWRLTALGVGRPSPVGR